MSAKKKEEPEQENEEGAAPEGEGGEGEGEGGEKKGKKKLLFIIIGAVVVLLIVAGVLLSGVLGGGEEKPKHEAAKHEEGHGKEAKEGEAAAGPAKPVYYELPQFLVNLNSTTGHVSFLKMGVTLELRDAEAVPIMDANKPRVMDTFNTYLRELRPTDIQGSAGIYRLRDELLKRLNGTIEEGLVKDILFSEIIVQ